MSISEFKYLQNKASLFAKCLFKPKKEPQRGMILGLKTMEAILYDKHIEVRLGPTEKWSAIQVDWKTKRLSCHICCGYDDWLSCEDNKWVCSTCSDYHLSSEQLRLNRFRKMIRNGNVQKLRTIRQGIIERRQALELEGHAEVHSAPIPLTEAEAVQKFCPMPLVEHKILPLERYGRLLWANHEYIWVVGYD